MTIDEICDACICALCSEGYNESTIFNYEGVIRRFKQFCAEQKVIHYSSEIGRAYADDVIIKKTGKFSENRYHTQGRFYRLIDSYHSTGTFDFSLMKKGRIVPNNEIHQKIYTELIISQLRIPSCEIIRYHLILDEFLVFAPFAALFSIWCWMVFFF